MYKKLGNVGGLALKWDIEDNSAMLVNEITGEAQATISSYGILEIKARVYSEFIMDLHNFFRANIYAVNMKNARGGKP